MLEGTPTLAVSLPSLSITLYVSGSSGDCDVACLEPSVSQERRVFWVTNLQRSPRE